MLLITKIDRLERSAPRAKPAEEPAEVQIPGVDVRLHPQAQYGAVPAVKKLGSPPRSESMRVGAFDDEVRGPAAADGKITFVGSGLNVELHHVDADDDVIPDDTQLQAMSLIPELDHRVFASELRNIA